MFIFYTTFGLYINFLQSLLFSLASVFTLGTSNNDQVFSDKLNCGQLACPQTLQIFKRIVSLEAINQLEDLLSDIHRERPESHESTYSIITLTLDKF